MKCNSGNIPVNAEDVEDFLLGQVEAQGFHGDFELMVVDVAVLVEVEELKLNKSSMLGTKLQNGQLHGFSLLLR